MKLLLVMVHALDTILRGLNGKREENGAWASPAQGDYVDDEKGPMNGD
jgi:hypothetical protein